MNIRGVIVTQLKVIEVSGGNVLHGLKSSDPGFFGFGEAYFSEVEPNAIKAWKRHERMVLNLIVPVGSIRFVLYDERPKSETSGLYQEVILSSSNYCRLTVPPMLWFGFQGLDPSTSILLNVANIEHDPREAERKEIEEFEYDWETPT